MTEVDIVEVYMAKYMVDFDTAEEIRTVFERKEKMIDTRERIAREDIDEILKRQGY